MSDLKFRPELHALEAREVPALNLFYNGADLLLTGTPTAGGTDTLLIANTGNNNFKVTDGTLNLGTYHVTQDIRVRLTSFDTSIDLELAGATLRGNVDFDLGAGDRDPSTFSYAFVDNASGAGKIRGDVTFRGGAGTEQVGVTGDGSGASIDIGGSIRAVGKSVATPLEDELFVGFDTEVHGDVSATRYTYTTIYATIDGDVNSNAADSPGGMGFALYGTVHGDVTATGGATAPGYYSFAHIYGTVDGDVQYNLTGRLAITSVDGTVGGDFTVRHTGGGTAFAIVFGEVKGNFTCTAKDDGAYDETDAYVEGVVRGDFRFKQTGAAGSSVVVVDGYVVGDADIDVGGANTRFAEVDLEGAIGGSATVVGRSNSISVAVLAIPGLSAQFGVPGLKAVAGNLTIRLGDGANSLDIEQLDPGATTIGGKLSYTGGSGADKVTIGGHNTFPATIKTGAGDDTVAFAPDATVGSATIDFGAGTDTWTPPSVIAFPVKLKQLP